MLVLTRKTGERVLIGDDIVITVLESRGDGVRIGIDAPRGIRIQRAEIVEAVGQANVEATKAASTSATAAADAEAQLKAALGLTPEPGASEPSTPEPSATSEPSAPAE